MDFLPDILSDSEDVADGSILIFEPHVDNASAIEDPIKGRQHLHTAFAKFLSNIVGESDISAPLIRNWFDHRLKLIYFPVQL